MSESDVTVRLVQHHDYQFDNTFGAPVAPLRTDEPPPLGEAGGPAPTQLLAAAVGNCLSASLLFACRKYRQDPGRLACEVHAEIGRNADKRLRVLGMTARLTLGVPGEGIEHLDRILGSFEDFCTVTGSVRAAIPVTVQVTDSAGKVLK